VGPRVDLDAIEEKNVCLCQVSNPGHLAHGYTDVAIPAPERKWIAILKRDKHVNSGSCPMAGFLFSLQSLLLQFRDLREANRLQNVVNRIIISVINVDGGTRQHT
jgi:hypothetical protein